MINNTLTRLMTTLSLVFFMIAVSCRDNEKDETAITIEWQNGKAVAVHISRSLLPALAVDSIKNYLEIQLSNRKVQPAILGEYRATSSGISFYPLIPFTPGLKYQVMLDGKSLGELEIPVADPNNPPAVAAIYPAVDTVPENLLKLYICFSKPMQEGQSLQHITLVKNGRDTVTGVFLDLNHELWSNDRTLLTLWLDPGRIKRDLQPNQQMGPPLQQGEQVALVIQKNWRDAHGATLAKPVQKTFYVGKRDESSPDISHWKIALPTAGTNEPLIIDCGETLDYILLNNSLDISDSSGTAVPGILTINETASIISFTPTGFWKNGNYLISCEARLEDLAGNNLNRLFDKDLMKNSKKEEQEVYRRSFVIK